MRESIENASDDENRTIFHSAAEDHFAKQEQLWDSFLNAELMQESREFKTRMSSYINENGGLTRAFNIDWGNR
jgi:hypothetical protein